LAYAPGGLEQGNRCANFVEGNIATMPKYVAFLRAINVGGHTVKMEALRRLFEEIGFANVETFIASGNVIFDSPAKQTGTLEKKIEVVLQDKLGYEVTTFIRSIAEVRKVVEYEAFPEAERKAEDSVLYVGFLQKNPGDEAQKRVLALATPVDDFQVFGRELYWLCRTKFSESRVSGAQIAKALGMPTTVRNATTVRKIAAKYS
jgi:uncharacterized protein (DUF1697 family)